VSLAIESISAGYDNVPVLKEVSLKVERGNICALMGRNGSGKTTVLRCINAILKPTQGRVIADGWLIHSLSRIEIARLISLVPNSGSFLFLLPGNDPDGFRCAAPCMVGPG
jgi:iron complex transport system ATP-binding protein